MSDLIVVAYPDEYRAAEVMADLLRAQSRYFVDLADAVYLTKDRDGKVKLHQSHDLTAAGAVGGALWGTAVGFLFLVPLLGAVVGAGIGALTASLTDYGIDDTFARSLSEQLTPGSSALAILLRSSTPDKLIPELSKFGGTVLQTSLSDEAEARLRAALAQVPAHPSAMTGGAENPGAATAPA
ncbi:MAG: DUF1269 domain-containing protein [Chloroflexota bacterium]